MANPRVLNAHRAALLAGIPEFIRACDPEWDQGAADALIFSILAARDDQTNYVVGIRNPAGSTEIYGPYGTRAAADKALAAGICCTTQGAQSAVFPLIPAPKQPTPPRRTK